MTTIIGTGEVGALHSREELEEMQRLPLQRKIQITTARIIEWYQHYDGKVYVAFSGGKDSTVLLDIVRRIYPDVPAVFSDTGLEFPEVREFVKSCENVTIVRPEMNFRKVIEVYGYPVISKRVADTVEYGHTPIESTTYKFAKCLQKRFGVIEGITDKGYITNSYHVHVTEHINAFDKLRFESQFQKLSPGGAISYIEVANLSDNIPAVLTVLKYIYDNIMYAELNTKSDYCQVCGWDKEIEIVDDDRGKLIWKCPNCGNTDKSKMNIARRTCGYIGLNDWNQGRTQEIKERYVHLGGDE